MNVTLSPTAYTSLKRHTAATVNEGPSEGCTPLQALWRFLTWSSAATRFIAALTQCKDKTTTVNFQQRSTFGNLGWAEDALDTRVFVYYPDTNCSPANTSSFVLAVSRDTKIERIPHQSFAATASQTSPGGHHVRRPPCRACTYLLHTAP